MKKIVFSLLLSILALSGCQETSSTSHTSPLPSDFDLPASFDLSTPTAPHFSMSPKESTSIHFSLEPTPSNLVQPSTPTTPQKTPKPLPSLSIPDHKQPALQLTKASPTP